MMRQRIARLTSSLLNPFIVSFITIIFIVLDTSESVVDDLKWAAIALVLSVLPVFSFVVYQVRRKKLDSIFPETQGQRKMIYLLASVVAAAGCGVMWWFKAPELLAASFTAGLAAIVIFMAINLHWKISLHTAFVAAAAMMLTLAYGAKAAWVFVLLPLVAWARLELRLHTPAQVITGALLAAGIISGVLWGFGVVG
jgi:membrane-associated phospholipid phosphatase